MSEITEDQGCYNNFPGTLPEIVECPGVYPPSNDSFLLLNEAEHEINDLLHKVRKPLVLEVGSGTGVVIISLLVKYPIKAVATDISYKAVRCTKINATRNGVDLEVRQGNLFKPINKGERFDLILFNPPYLFEDYFDDFLSPDEHLSLVGLTGNWNIIENFLANVRLYLTSIGRALVILNERGFYYLQKKGILRSLNTSIVSRRDMGDEILLVLRIRK